MFGSQDIETSTVHAILNCMNSGLPKHLLLAKDTLSALNAEASISRNVWIAFNLALFVIAITTQNISHADFLIGRSLKLPIVDLGVPIFYFAVAAPTFVLIIHIAILLEHSILASKTLELNRALLRPPFNDSERDWARDQISAYFPVQNALAGHANYVLRNGLRFIGWFTLEIFPLLTLLLLQFQFLVYQNAAITFWQRAIIISDAVFVLCFNAISRNPDLSMKKAWASLWANDKFVCIRSVAMTTLVISISWMVAVGLEEMNHNLNFSDQLDHLTGDYLFGGKIERFGGIHMALFHRGLVLQKMDLKQLEMPNIETLDISERNFIQADFTGAKMEKVNFSGANISNASFAASDMQGSQFDYVVAIGTDFSGADLQKTVWGCSNSNHVVLPKKYDLDFFNANRLGEICLLAPGAIFMDAKLQGVSFSGAFAPASQFSGAEMQGAIFNGVFDLSSFVTSNFWLGSLSGSCKYCDFKVASLQGTKIRADLNGSDFRGAYAFLADFNERNEPQNKSPKFVDSETDFDLLDLTQKLDKDQTTEIFTEVNGSEESDADEIAQIYNSYIQAASLGAIPRDVQKHLHQLISETKSKNTKVRAEEKRKAAEKIADVSCRTGGLFGRLADNGIMIYQSQKVPSSIFDGMTYDQGIFYSSVQKLCPDDPITKKFLENINLDAQSN